MNAPGKSTRRPGVPPPQDNLDRARELGFEALLEQPEEQIAWLGAHAAPGGWCLPVLGDELYVDPTARKVTTPDFRPIGLPWSILALHYLAIPGRPESQPPQVTFADLPTARSYASVYQGRVIARLCATAGRDIDKLRAAAEGLGAVAAEGGDAAFDFHPFPRLTLRLIWHAPDEEFPPSATLLLPANIEQHFSSEDIVVLSECLVSRLGGRPF